MRGECTRHRGADLIVSNDEAVMGRMLAACGASSREKGKHTADEVRPGGRHAQIGSTDLAARDGRS